MAIPSNPTALLFFYLYHCASRLLSTNLRYISLFSLLHMSLDPNILEILAIFFKALLHRSLILLSFNSTSLSFFLMHLVHQDQDDTSSDIFFPHLAILMTVFTAPCSSKLLDVSLYAIHFGFATALLAILLACRY